MYKIIFYTTERGESPIDEFLDEVDKKSLAKIQAHFNLLEEFGPDLKRPYADHVRGPIRELRVSLSTNEYRMLYFFLHKKKIVVTHAFRKKTQQLKERDIELAERRMQEWINRFP